MGVEFISKKNKVFLENGIVTKVFSEESKWQCEKLVNEVLQSYNVEVPQIINIDNSNNLYIIRYEYIEGNLYSELIKNLKREEAVSLLKWIDTYNTVIGKYHPDLNLRNFIYNDKRSCVGIDFEETILDKEYNKYNADPVLQNKQGTSLRIERDIGKIIAFIGTYDPVFSENKRRSVELIINCSYELFSDLDIKKVCEEYFIEIEEMFKRRSHLPFTRQESIDFIERYRA